MKSTSGYVLVLVLFIISICVVLITAIVRSSFIFQRQAYFSLDNEKAKLFALSGLELALDQISLVVKEEKDEDLATHKKEENNDNKAKNEKDSIEKLWFAKLINVIDVVQVFKFDDNNFGADGEINFYISCEQGKINLRQLNAAIKFESNDEDEDKTDVEKKKEINPKKTYLGTIDTLIQKQIHISIVNAIRDFNKKFNRNLEDPTELLLLPNLKKLKDSVFPEFSTNKIKPSVYLMDLFTLSSGSGRINPWFISLSFAKILGFSDKQKTQDLKNKFKPNMDWAKDWDNVLAPIYGKNYSTIEEEIRKMFAPTFEAAAFSVLVMATVGSAVQRIFAICERNKDLPNVSQNSIVYKVSKIYWL